MATALPHRRVRFEWPDDLTPIWCPDVPELAIAADAVSLLMPHAEPYIVGVTRAAVDEGLVDDPQVVAAARGYVAQEAGHHAQHRRFNDLIVADAPGAARVDRWFATWFGWLRRRSTRFGLAFAASFETIAFVAARWVDRRQRLLRGADPTVATLFLWHLAEEVEHKRVAFDTYRAAGGGRLRHAAAMVTAALVLAVGALVGSLALLRATGRLWRPGSHLRLAGWSLSFVLTAVPVMVVSLLPGHHPDQLVDPAGLERWLDHLDPDTATVPEWALP
ncbi:MAG: metal-dependent hydrolase [Acidimicrobiales bacterium]